VSVATQPPILWVLRALSSRWGMKLITHLHLVFKLRMHGTVSPLPKYVFMTWCLSAGYIFIVWYLVKHRDNFNLT